ncbi:MAG: 4Fe-4S binding protein, partial [Candidatus Wallbacteria bacterium]|nr:4Fe-4S binding protein [Candidatus Wallbacteria bacterium]
STLRWFRNEYDSHVKDRVCPAGVCKALIEYTIDPEACDGCHACVKQCSTGAIAGEVKVLHTLDRAMCIKCGVCIEVCNRHAILKRPSRPREAGALC